MWRTHAHAFEDRVRALEAPKEQPALSADLSRRGDKRRLALALAAVAALLLAASAVAAGGWAR